MPRLVALLLAAAATAASAESDENNFTAASADEGRVKKFAAQSYDWLADRAPAAKAFAAQAAAQHGPGFVGGALADAPAGPVSGQRLRGGRGVGTRAFLRSFVVAVLTPPPSLPPVYYNTPT